MAHFVRFIVHQKIGGESRQVGVFSAAFHLRDEVGLFAHDRKRLNDLLTWFRKELPIPPDDAIPDQAIFWYRNVAPFTMRMWELVQLLKDYDFTAEQITRRQLGRIFYQDKYQVAALPPRSDQR